MGLFFQDIERKSSKSIKVIRVALLIGVFALLILGLMNDLDFLYTGLSFILLAIFNFLNGAESHYHQEKKQVYVPQYLLGVILFTMAITYLN
jgi:hypothetical protein